MSETHSVTFLCDSVVYELIQEEADKNFEGKISFQLRKILKEWSEKNEH